jgi:hypothetical protein
MEPQVLAHQLFWVQGKTGESEKSARAHTRVWTFFIHLVNHYFLSYSLSI